MKKLLVGLLAVGLLFAFAMPAAASEMKMSGTFFITGNYEDNPAMNSSDEASSASSSWMGQRARVTTRFQVEEGLSMTFRADIAERLWDNDDDVTHTTSATGGDDEQQIDFDHVYLTANMGFGTLTAGWAADDFALKLGNNGGYSALVKYVAKLDPVEVELRWIKDDEADNGVTNSDADLDRYAAGVKYGFEGGFVGAYYIYTVDKTTATSDKVLNDFRPYFKGSFGPLAIQAELSYEWGEREYDAVGTADDDFKGFAYWVDASVAVGPATIGGEYFHVDGDDLTTLKEDESNSTGLGNGVSGALIMFDYWANKWNGVGAGDWGNGAVKTNVDLYKVYAKFSPVEKLTLYAALFHATAPEKTAAGTVGNLDDEYGQEFDITATYKIYDNLSYMVGFGYVWTGDYWKTSAADKVDDDYLITNKLSLSF